MAAPAPAMGLKNEDGMPLISYTGAAAHAPNNFDTTGKYKLRLEGAFSAVEVAIGAEDGIKAQGGAMVTMSENVDIDTRLEGGLGSSLLRCCCAGASLFFSHFKLLHGSGPRGDVLLAPAVPGEIVMINLDGSHGWVVQPAGFLACDESVIIGVKMLGLAQGCCGGEGFFVMEATGQGRLLACTYGSILRYDLAPGERRKIDNGHCVAWTSGMHWSIKKAGKSLIKSVVSGEGLVACFTGPGTVYVQSRSLSNLAAALVPYLPRNTTNINTDNSS